MANPMELEAAKYLHKLINESKDEPINLAEKLYRILQHMRSSGKENSIPYHVISRGLETIIKQHNLDIGTLISSCTQTTGILIGDSTSSQLAGSSKQVEFNKDLKSSFDGNEMSTPETCVSTRVQNYPGTGGPDIYKGSTDIIAKMQYASSPVERYDFSAKMGNDMSIETFPAATFGDHFSGKTVIGKTSDHGGSSMLMNANKGCFSSSVPGGNIPGTTGFEDTGSSFVPQGSRADLPFTRQQLKQLRAQCLVHLAFSKCMRPTKLQLDVALGNLSAKEEKPFRNLIDQKGKEQVVHELSSGPQFIRSSNRGDSSKCPPSILWTSPAKEADNATFSEDGALAVLAEKEKDRKESVELHASAFREPLVSSTWSRNYEDDIGNRQQPCNLAGLVRDTFEQSMLERSFGPGNHLENEMSKVSLPTTYVVPEAVIQKKADATSLSQTITDWNSLENQHCDRKLKCQLQPVSGMSHQDYLALPVKDSDIIKKNVSHVLEADQEDVDALTSTDRQPLSKHTTIGKWILASQKRKFLIEQNWEWKQQKIDERIAARSAQLKEIVNSAEDISAKTKSVIELKKLQLVEFQRCLRSEILDDFYRPIDSQLDKLKSIKKNKIGRRSKQNEKYEQRMKEERQKRDRERQKEFFSELEAQRGRLEDGFKLKRECSKGFNKNVREFHKKKEKFHREKIDQIQQETINLLKINDVEGYLRMVEGAKSDRVSQLLKQTEEYMHKLRSKLKEAKSVARHFENDMEESNSSCAMQENEMATEIADEKDQAQHYLESNEKYYLMAHSVKENIMEQPTSLENGKLREYQMNGLRWLVSLYNNHLNGILADEMGLGKTIQVISLICYLMEIKKDRGPFLVVVPSSVLPGWESEIDHWAPSIKKIVYTGSPEDRRALFKEQIAPQKFNVLLTTYEYMMNKHDRPKLSKVQWHYIIIDEGHRIKNASCKLNADLKQYRSNHRLLLTGTPLQNNIEELWALLNFLLPNIFNSSEDFSQWFNKPFKGNGENSSDEALLSEEENLLIINRLHQVLRPFVLRRLKHKVENELPEKIERLIRCEASAYQKLLIKRVEDNLGAIGTSKARSVHNSVMELRNICNHPYLSQLHVEEVHELIPKHFLPNNVRLCGKFEMLDRLLPKLKATDHRVLLFSTMTRLLDVLEDYLSWKQYKYLRLDGQTSGGDRGALIEQFNQPGSPFFIFLLSIRAGGVGVNLQAADTVIIFNTDWNPQIDLQAQARAHRIGQKKDVLVLRLETVQTVEEQVRASAEHKLGVANQSITAGFFDNNTSAEDRREYLESLLRECKKEEVAPVLDDDSLNYTIARSEAEIHIFESVDKQRRSDEMVTWENMLSGKGSEIPPLPSRLLTDDDLKSFYEVMKISEARTLGVISNAGMKRKRGYVGDLDTQEYGRGKRTKEVRTYEDDWTEEDFERIGSDDSPQSPVINEKIVGNSLSVAANDSVGFVGAIQTAAVPQLPAVNPPAPQNTETTQPIKRGRGRPKKVESPKSPVKEEIVRNTSPLAAANDSVGLAQIPGVNSLALQNTKATPPIKRGRGRPRKVDSTESLVKREEIVGKPLQVAANDSVGFTGFHISEATPSIKRGRGRPRKVVGASPLVPCPEPSATRKEETSEVETHVVPSPGDYASSTLVRSISPSTQQMGKPIITSARGRKSNSGGEAPAPRRRGKNQLTESQAVPMVASITGSPSAPPNADLGSQGPVPSSLLGPDSSDQMVVLDTTLSVSSPQDTPHAPFTQSIILSLPAINQGKGEGLNTESCEETPQRKRRRQENEISVVSGSYNDQDSALTEPPHKRTRASVGKTTTTRDEKDQAVANSDLYVTQDVIDPSAERIPTGTEIAEDESEDLPHEQYPKEQAKDNSNEVLPSKSQLGDSLPSTSTLDTVARALSPPISEPGSQPDREYAVQHENEQSDNEGPLGDNSLISKPEVSSIVYYLGISDDSLTLPLLSSTSVEMGNDNESQSGKDGDEITESAEKFNKISEEATDVVPEMMKDSFDDDESGKVLTIEPENNTILIEIPVSAAEVTYPEMELDRDTLTLNHSSETKISGEGESKDDVNEKEFNSKTEPSIYEGSFQTATTRDEKDQPLPNADLYATQDAADPSAEQLPTGIEIAEDKFEIPPQEQYPNEQEAKDNANEVFPLTSQLGDSLPSISTTDPVAETLAPSDSESGSQLAIEYAEQYDNKESENKGPPEDSSFALMPELSTTVNNLRMSENSESLPVFSSKSVETEKDGESLIGKQSDEMTEPAKMPNPNDSVAQVKLFEGATKSVSETIKDSSSDESAKLLVGELNNNAVLTGVPVSAAEVVYPESEPSRDTLNQLHEAKTSEEREIKTSISDEYFDCETKPNISDGSFPTFSISLAVDSIDDMSECLGDGNEGKKMVESVKSPHLEESLASHNLSGETPNVIPELLEEKEENTAYEVPVLSTEVALPA